MDKFSLYETLLISIIAYFPNLKKFIRCLHLFLPQSLPKSQKGMNIMNMVISFYNNGMEGTHGRTFLQLIAFCSHIRIFLCRNGSHIFTYYESLQLMNCSSILLHKFYFDSVLLVTIMMCAISFLHTVMTKIIILMKMMLTDPKDIECLNKNNVKRKAWNIRTNKV